MLMFVAVWAWMHWDVILFTAGAVVAVAAIVAKRTRNTIDDAIVAFFNEILDALGRPQRAPRPISAVTSVVSAKVGTVVAKTAALGGLVDKLRGLTK